MGIVRKLFAKIQTLQTGKFPEKKPDDQRVSAPVHATTLFQHRLILVNAPVQRLALTPS